MSAYEKYYQDKNKRLENQIELLEEKVKSLMVIIEQGEELRAKHVVELCDKRNKINHENKFLKEVLKKCYPRYAPDAKCNFCGQSSLYNLYPYHTDDCEYIKLIGGDEDAESKTNPKA